MLKRCNNTIKEQDMFQYDIRLNFDKDLGEFKTTFGGWITIIVQIILNILNLSFALNLIH